MDEDALLAAINNPGPPLTPDDPVVYLQWNDGWGNWEQVCPGYAGEAGVVAFVRQSI